MTSAYRQTKNPKKFQKYTLLPTFWSNIICIQPFLEELDELEQLEDFWHFSIFKEIQGKTHISLDLPRQICYNFFSFQRMDPKFLQNMPNQKILKVIKFGVDTVKRKKSYNKFSQGEVKFTSPPPLIGLKLYNNCSKYNAQKLTN